MRPDCGDEISAGCSSATICARPLASPNRTSESAAFPRTIGDGSFKHLQQRLVKSRAGRVLPHHPRIGIAHFLDRIGRQAH